MCIIVFITWRQGFWTIDNLMGAKVIIIVLERVWEREQWYDIG